MAISEAAEYPDARGNPQAPTNDERIMDPLTNDLVAMRELARRDAQSLLLGDRVCRALSLGLLAEGVRRCGTWARQLRVGTLSILIVCHDPRDLKRVLERERFVTRLRSSRT